jgi:hypothetical protein
MYKNVISIMLAMCATATALSCQKDLPEQVKASMEIYTLRPLTHEELKAIDARTIKERVAIVRELLNKNNAPQESLTDAQADAMYRTALNKAAEDYCKQQ